MTLIPILNLRATKGLEPEFKLKFNPEILQRFADEGKIQLDKNSRESWVVSRESWVVSRGSWVVSIGSWICVSVFGSWWLGSAELIKTHSRQLLHVRGGPSVAPLLRDDLFLKTHITDITTTEAP